MALTKITGEGVGAVDDVTIEGHASVGVNAVDATRALTVAGSTDDSSASGLVVYNSSLASKFSVRNDGYITAAGDIQLGGSLYVGGTAAANALDDYEEGTWTPTIDSLTYSTDYVVLGSDTTAETNTLRYTKIGRMVYIYGAIRFKATHTLRFAMSIPFNFANSNYGMSGGATGYAFANAGSLGFLGNGANGKVDFFAIDPTTGGHSSIPVTSGDEIYFNIHYEAT